MKEMVHKVHVHPEFKMDTTFDRDTSILEAIIHVNYGHSIREYIDLNKIFNIFKTRHIIPFIRYRGDKKSKLKYRFHNDLTHKHSPIYVDKSTIIDWTTSVRSERDPKTGEKKQVTLSGKGLSFKVYMYNSIAEDGTEIRKYMTVNLYKDGKLEIKCFWDEKNAGSWAKLRELIGSVRDIV